MYFPPLLFCVSLFGCHLFLCCLLQKLLFCLGPSPSLYLYLTVTLLLCSAPWAALLVSPHLCNLLYSKVKKQSLFRVVLLTNEKWTLIIWGKGTPVSSWDSSNLEATKGEGRTLGWPSPLQQNWSSAVSSGGAEVGWRCMWLQTTEVSVYGSHCDTDVKLSFIGLFCNALPTRAIETMTAVLPVSSNQNPFVFLSVPGHWWASLSNSGHWCECEV